MKELVGISLAKKKNRNGKRILHFHTGGQRVGAYIYKSNSYTGNCGRRLAGSGMGGVACLRGHKVKRQGNSLQPVPQPLSMYDTGLHFMKKLNRF